jgi:hypothetical protein
LRCRNNQRAKTEDAAMKTKDKTEVGRRQFFRALSAGAALAAAPLGHWRNFR